MINVIPLFIYTGRWARFTLCYIIVSVSFNDLCQCFSLVMIFFFFSWGPEAPLYSKIIFSFSTYLHINLYGGTFAICFLGGVPIKVHFTIYFFLVNYRNTWRFLYNYFLFLSVIRVGQSFSWRMWKRVVSITGYCGCRLKPLPTIQTCGPNIGLV